MSRLHLDTPAADAAPSLTEGAFAALLLTGLTWAAGSLLPLVGLYPSLPLLMAALAGGYVTYLAARAPAGVGRVAVPVGWLLLAATIWLAATTPATQAAAHLLLLWLARCLLFRRHLAGAAADLGVALAGAALAAAAWRYGHGAVVVTWCFFLTQALFPALGQARRQPARVPVDPFEAAARRAEVALQRAGTSGTAAHSHNVPLPPI